MTKPKFPYYAPMWFVQLAEEMVWRQVGIKEACEALNLRLDPDEMARVERRREFKDAVRSERHKFYAAVANDPARTKSSAIGAMLISIEQLQLAGEHDKAVQAIDKLGKMEGWVGADSSINVFAGLSSKDIAEAKARLEGNIKTKAGHKVKVLSESMVGNA